MRPARNSGTPLPAEGAVRPGSDQSKAKAHRDESRHPVLGRLTANHWTRRTLRIGTLLVLDAAGCAAGVAAAVGIDTAFGGDVEFSAARTMFLLLFALTAAFFAEAGLYGARESRPGLARMVVSQGRVAVVLLVIALVADLDGSPWYVLFTALLLSSTVVCSLRGVYSFATGRALRSIGYRRRAVLVGTGVGIDAIAPALGLPSQTTYEAMGYFSLDGVPRNDLPDLGEVEAMPAWLDANPVEEVIITDPDLPQERAVRLINECQSRGIRVRIAPSTIEVLSERPSPVPGAGVALVEVKAPAIGGADYAVKRVFDFVIAGGLLIVMSPFLLLVALAVKLTSRGPVLHHSLRPGIDGQPFHCLKFRTMYMDAEERQADLEHLNEASGPIFKIREDPRVTPLGRFLRRNSIDEMPQLINVLRGQLSLVGPRPLPLRDHALLEDWHRRRYSVLPGITGLWQISGRSNLTFDDMVRLDFLYIERWSVLLDLTILLKTIPAVLRRRGAY